MIEHADTLREGLKEIIYQILKNFMNRGELTLNSIGYFNKYHQIYSK